ncbi:MAG: iron-containing alcohol dehydrogenase [Coriobacteriia bacterium]|nr:iron-containing alcohol dehydrogenase [Coriobacteriia bacterium]
MNAPKTLFCRTYQTVFRAALPVLPYRDPETLASVEETADLLVQKGKTCPLIVTDKSIHELGLIDGLKEALVERQMDYVIFDETVPNPTIQNVEDARAQYLENNCDCLIAFGGGSAMDCAKACGARLVQPWQSVQQMRGILKVLHPLPLFVAIPTTAGTGSETTLAAVITDGETHYKYPINSFPLIPHYACLDYRTTVGLPKHITSTTGIDALVHATEAYIGRSTTAETRAAAVEAVTLIRLFLKRAYDDGSDVEARAHMLRAANRAGMAFSKSYVGYVHAVAHSLGGQYGIPHGLANAVICPYVLDLYGTSCHKRLGALARESGVAPAAASDAEASRIYIQWFRDLNASLDIPTKLEGIRCEDIPLMAKRAAKEANPLYPVPKEMTAEQLEVIYRLVMA